MAAMDMDAAIGLYAVPDPKPERIHDEYAYREFHALDLTCLVCDQRPVNAAHLIGKGRGGDTVLANLVPLCGSGSGGCHGAYDNGHSYHTGQGEKITPAYVKRCVGFWLLSADGEESRWYVTARLGVEGSQEFLRSLGVKLEDVEPPGAGRDPYGRPDPRTHPEYWTE